jgi:hypothetical protein
MGIMATRRYMFQEEVVFGFEPMGTHADSVSDVRRRICVAASLTCMSIIAVVVSVQGIWRPASEPIGVWVMRSGALVTVFAILADHLLAEGLQRLPNPLIRYAPWMSFQRKLLALQVILGTVIWGYGDLLPFLSNP